LLDAVIVDADAGHHCIFTPLTDLDTAAPRQELGIVLDAGDQIEHLLGAITEEN
jgi:hypothetical protein